MMMNYDAKYIKNLLPKRAEDSHKGTFGHILNIAGSGFYSGAAYFSSLAPLKVGAGKSTLASVETTLRAVAALCPDIILLPRNLLNKELLTSGYQAVSIGCGLSTDKSSARFFKKIIMWMRESQIPLVIDADGLNILALLPPHLRDSAEQTVEYRLGEVVGVGGTSVQLPPNTILTPHPTEMSRLMGVSTENILENQEFWAQKCAEKYKCTVVLKTHKTVVADNKGHLYVNNTGNSALAKGGSGDVLCGMITGFLAQGLKPFDASILAVYLHGKTGEIAGRELTEYSVLASDLLNYIHLALSSFLC